MQISRDRAWPYLVAAVVVIALLAGARAQEPIAPPAFRGSVDVVQLDVTVLDRARKPVRGLTAADFTVLDGAGRSQRIVGVEAVELPRAVPPSAIDAVAPDVISNQVDAQRLVVIVFDDANTGVTKGFGESYRDSWITQAGKRIARDIVERLGPRDLGAVVFTYMGRPQNFTADHQRLLAAIDAFAPQNAPLSGPPLACDYKGRGNCVIATLKAVAEALPSLPPRRKLIVFISQGHRLPMISADDDGSLNVASSDRLLEIDEMQAMLQALQRSNAAVYAYSPGGLQVASGEVHGDALRGLAEHTGGQATVETNAPWNDVSAMFDETGAYYLVAFETTETDGRFHRVQVRVNRPDAIVRTRAGYYAPRVTPPATAAGTNVARVTAVEHAIAGGLPTTALSLSAVAFARPMASARTADVTVITRVDVPHAAAGSAEPTVEFLAAAFDKDWRERASDRRTVAISPRGGVTSQNTTAELTSTLHLRPGRYELRIAAEAEGRAGSVYVDIDVPDFASDEMSLSGPMVVVGNQGFATVQGSSPAPTVRRTFSRGEAVTVLTQIWQGGHGRPEPVVVSAHVRDSAGRELWQQESRLPIEAFATDRTTSHSALLPLSTLPPGEYLFTLQLTRKRQSMERQIRFEVR